MSHAGRLFIRNGMRRMGGKGDGEGVDSGIGDFTRMM
jgi:hypothetical protein